MALTGENNVNVDWEDEGCDCVQVSVSSKSCKKCGRKATIPGWHNAAIQVELENLRFLLDEVILDARVSLRYNVEVLELINKVRDAMSEAERIGREHGERYKETNGFRV